MAEEKRWLGKRERCDICGADISKSSFVDGRITLGPWALMCIKCFNEVGLGLGTGVGQQYNAEGLKIVG